MNLVSTIIIWFHIILNVVGFGFAAGKIGEERKGKYRTIDCIVSMIFAISLAIALYLA